MNSGGLCRLCGRKVGADILCRLPAILSHRDTRDLDDFFDVWRKGIKDEVTTQLSPINQRISSVGIRGVSSNCLASCIAACSQMCSSGPRDGLSSANRLAMRPSSPRMRMPESIGSSPRNGIHSTSALRFAPPRPKISPVMFSTIPSSGIFT